MRVRVQLWLYALSSTEISFGFLKGWGDTHYCVGVSTDAKESPPPELPDDEDAQEGADVDGQVGRAEEPLQLSALLRLPELVPAQGGDAGGGEAAQADQGQADHAELAFVGWGGGTQS